MAGVLEEEAITGKKGREEEEKREGKGRKKRKKLSWVFSGFFLNLEEKTMIESVWGLNQDH